MEEKPTGTVVISSIPTVAAENGKKPPLDGEKRNKKRGSFTLFKAAMSMMRRRPEGKAKPIQPEVESKGVLEKLVGSMRPLHLQDDQSPPPSVHPTTPSPDRDMSTSLSSPHRSSSCSADSMSLYASATNLHELDKEGESPYAYKATERRYASSTNLQELDKQGGESPYASYSNLQELDTRGSKSPYTFSRNLPKLDKGSHRPYASCTNLQELGNKGKESAYESSTNLRKLGKGSHSRYASAMNLLELGGETDDDDKEEDSDDETKDDNGGDEMIDAKAEDFIAKFYKQMQLQHLKSVERSNKKMPML